MKKLFLCLAFLLCVVGVLNASSFYDPLPPNAIVKLATVTGINCGTIGATTLYTVPTGKQCVFTNVVLRWTTIEGWAAMGGGSLGSNSTDYNDYVDGIFSAGFSTEATAVGFSLSSVATPVLKSGNVLKVNITGTVEATTAIMAIDVFGYLF